MIECYRCGYRGPAEVHVIQVSRAITHWCPRCLLLLRLEEPAELEATGKCTCCGVHDAEPGDIVCAQCRIGLDADEQDMARIQREWDAYDRDPPGS